MPRFKSMPGAGVLLVAALGLAASASVLLLPVEPPLGGECPNALECEVRAPEGGRLGVGFEFGAGYNATLCRFVTLPASSATREVSLPLPAGRIEVLRLFASSPSVQAGVHAMRVVDFRGNLVLRFDDADLRADGRIALRGPILLPTVPRPGDPVVGRERALALSLMALGAVLIALLLRCRGGGKKIPVWLYHAALGLSAVAVVFARRPSVFVRPQFWAEDGTVFFPGRLDGWHGLFEPQANYLALLPRFTALLADFAPVLHAPLVYALVALATCVVAALKAASPRVGLPLAPIAALAVLLVPSMEELLPSMANVHWFGAVILVLVAASQVPSSRWQAIGDASLVVLFGLSGPFIVALSPVIVWRAVRTRSRAAWATAALALIAAGLQIATYRRSTAGGGAAPLPSVPTMLAAVGYRTGGQMFGLSPSPLFANPLTWGTAGAALLVLIWLLFPLRVRGRDLRPLLAWAALSAVAGGFLRYAGYAGQFFEPVFIDRYFYETLVFTLWILVGALGTSGARRWIAAALLALVVACNAGRFRLPPFAELDWPHYARAIEQGKAVTVPINPQAWFVDVPGRH